MSDASEAFGSPHVHRVGGEEVQFPRLHVRDYGMLEKSVRQKMQDVDRELLDECQVTGKERFDKLRETANFAVSAGHVREALGTSEFARKALRMSLVKGGRTEKDADALIDRMDPLDLSFVAEVVVGFLRPLPEAAGTTGSPSPRASDATTPEPTPAA